VRAAHADEPSNCWSKHEPHQTKTANCSRAGERTLKKQELDDLLHAREQLVAAEDSANERDP